MKRYVDWEGDLHSFLMVGDLVDEAMVEYFLNVVPAATQDNICIQIGEPYNHVQGKPVFDTLKKTEQGWVYAGLCFKGKTEPYTKLIKV